ncbi:ATP-dependent sacrificial sulfur transferase LarE [Methanosphaera sp. ISO3-F5]|uniref:ATP-dependent sacrificial sulfur transferase LarE n=1 Tax=Methanosphaera sp. ISO3-F5 TaxID=1452353 RepID=UPI002B25863F|nr:ATP-dependent sacrificial sulfur transferase LarE [Methanosphaera sp. ISO3-F5]WQH64164.1 ATP-dependent sacrificial sulfur transferase LarE [Methanosphaera sp. ISO3-F5]
MKIEEKIGKLEEYLRNKKSILGFSAGSDSTLLAYILSKVSPESILVTINNNMMPKEFIEYTKTQAKKFNLKHKVINIDFLTHETFQNNTKERCYECRNLMYCNIQKLPEFNDYDYFIEGTNITDLLEDRPGILVLDKYNMISPLVECNITKEEVFQMIKYFNLEYSYDTTCLATRVKTNQQVNREKLTKIYKAEQFVRKNIDQENIRVRTDKNNATISVDEPLKILNEKLIKKLRDKLQELGYSKVFLDITGYEKTELTYKIDETGKYYHQLPYPIDIEKTYQNLKNKYDANTLLKIDDKISYEDIIIQENGKITINPTEKFIDKFNKILSCVKRKYYEK